jgi:hypothetical protein
MLFPDYTRLSSYSLPAATAGVSQRIDVHRIGIRKKAARLQGNEAPVAAR